MSEPTGRTCHRPTVIEEIINVWQSVLAMLFDRYRPELHYMRGAGPKCREKALRCNAARAAPAATACGGELLFALKSTR
jgi:hypothetical protein